VSVCVGHADELCQKTAKPIEMPFGGHIRVGPRNRALDGDLDACGK